MTAIQWTILLVILTICDCQEQPVYHIRPDNCQQEKCCSYSPPDCMTLSEYALNIKDTMNSRLELSPGKYYLNSTFSINGTSTQNFSMNGDDSENTVIICTQKDANLRVHGLSFMTIENVSFVSCGVDTVPGVSLTNIDTVNLVDTSFSKSTSGALDIQNCSSVQLTDLLITNNFNSKNTIVHVNSSNILILSSLLIANNSMKTTDSSCDGTEVMFRIDGGSIDADSIQVTDNIVPFGVLVVTNAVVTVNGDWRFERNQVCVGGSLAFVKTTVDFIGNLYFVNNIGNNENVLSLPSLLLNETTINLRGTFQSIRNKGYITSILFMMSRLLISEGSLILTDNCEALQAFFLSERSEVNINGSLIAHNNSFRQRIFLNEFSSIIVNGFVSFINNPPSTPVASYSGTLKLIGQIEFEKNAGVMYAVKSNIYISGNSTFKNNSAEDDFTDGALAVLESNLVMEGIYNFKDTFYDEENGGGIWATVVSNVRLSGTGYFINNTANNGGGIFIDQLSRLELNKGTRLYFINNTAVKGAAIFIGTSVQHAQCQFNSNECLFGLEDNNNHDVTLTFEHNKAYPGASIIHVNFDVILNTSIEYPALDTLNRTVNIRSNNSSPHYASDSYWFCFCEDNSRENCIRNDPPATITAYKGKPFSVKARALKFYGSEMSEPVRASLESSLSAVDSNSMVNASLIGNNGKLQSVSATECSNFTFTVKSTNNNEVVLMNVGETFIGVEKSLKLNVQLNSVCQPGFPFNDNKDSCECDESIREFLKSCKITDEVFQKRREYTNYWIAPSNNPHYQAEMSYYEYCPNRYCITDGEFTFSDDGICANNRSGLLCGQCKGNYSLLLGGESCEDCSDNAHLALILVFAVAGIILLVFIFLTQMTVSAGTLNGLIFYANVLNSNRSVFFPENFFRGYIAFISWLNLNFGIDTCFFNGLNQITYSGLQFVFPLYMWFLAGVIIILCRYSVRVSKFFGNSDPVAVLATIIFLSFNSLTQNVISIFYFSTLNLPGNNSIIVWRYDGNVDYLAGNHLIFLIFAAVFFLFLLTPYTFIIFLAPLLQKSKFISKMLRHLRLQPFIHAYLIPFKPQHRYWVGLCLIMRAVLLIFFAFGENQHLNLLLIVSTCIIAISTFVVTGGIYDKNWIDKLEVSFFVNLGLLTSTTLFALSTSQTLLRKIATYISITVTLLTFIGIVILQIFWRLKKSKILNKKVVEFLSLTKKANELKSTKKQNLNINQPLSTDEYGNSVPKISQKLIYHI